MKKVAGHNSRSSGQSREAVLYRVGSVSLARLFPRSGIAFLPIITIPELSGFVNVCRGDFLQLMPASHPRLFLASKCSHALREIPRN